MCSLLKLLKIMLIPLQTRIFATFLCSLGTCIIEFVKACMNIFLLMTIILYYIITTDALCFTQNTFRFSSCLIN